MPKATQGTTEPQRDPDQPRHRIVDPKDPSVTPFDQWIEFRRKEWSDKPEKTLEALIAVDGNTAGAVRILESYFYRDGFTAADAIALLRYAEDVRQRMIADQRGSDASDDDLADQHEGR